MSDKPAPQLLQQRLKPQPLRIRQITWIHLFNLKRCHAGNHAGRRGYSHSRCHCYSRAGWHRYSHSGCHRYSNRARCHRYYHAAATPAASDMAKVQTNMTENMAGMDAADAGMKTHMDTMKAGMKSDMEMKHSMIAQMQVMSDQIKELNERVTALSAKLETPAKPVKAAKAAKPAVRAPIKPVY